MRYALLSEEAYDRVRQWILGGRISAGSIIRESALSRELNMSRTPIREALRRLEAEGLIARISQGGYVLFELDAQALSDVYAVLSSLQGLAARLAAKKQTRTDLGRMTDVLEAIEAAMERGDEDEITRLNRDFHDAVAQASRNEYLRSALKNVSAIVVRYRPHRSTPAGLREFANSEHRAMLDAIAARDPDRAEEITRRHVEHGLAARLESLTQNRSAS